MEVIWFLLPLAIFMAALAVIGLFWAGRSGQFDDLDSPAMDLLIEEDSVNKEKGDE